MVAVRAASGPAGRGVVGPSTLRVRQQRAVFRRLGSAATMAALLAVPVLGASPARAYSSQQWALDYLKASQDWNVSKGANVTVAVLDSGVASISDLSGQVLSGADFANGTTSVGNGRTDTDNDGHGTGMASVIAGNGARVSGFAPSAKILPVRIDASGKGTMFASNVAAGIRYATQAHAGVINLSIGGNVDFGPEVQEAISQAIAANIVVVAAARQRVRFVSRLPGRISGSGRSRCDRPERTGLVTVKHRKGRALGSGRADLPRQQLRSARHLVRHL